MGIEQAYENEVLCIQHMMYDLRRIDMPENSHRYFKNDKCKYYPCHKIEEGQDFNCLFCYCPMNCYEDCPGTPRYITRESGKRIKDCTNCTFPHIPENYDYIVQFLAKKMR